MSSTIKFIATKIKQISEDQDLSATQLASKSNLTKQYVYQIFNGEANVSIEKLESICNALGVHISQVLPSNPQEEFSFIKNKISSLPDQKRQLITEIIEHSTELNSTRDLNIINELLKTLLKNQ